MIFRSLVSMMKMKKIEEQSISSLYVFSETPFPRHWPTKPPLGMWSGCRISCLLGISGLLSSWTNVNLWVGNFCLSSFCNVTPEAMLSLPRWRPSRGVERVKWRPGWRFGRGRWYLWRPVEGICQRIINCLSNVMIWIIQLIIDHEWRVCPVNHNWLNISWIHIGHSRLVKPEIVFFPLPYSNILPSTVL